MINIVQSEIDKTRETLNPTALYLVSKPAALLSQVETCMANALRADPALTIHGATEIQNAAQYHLQSGGQRLRARLALSAAQAVGLSDHDCIRIAASVELLHNASLIHDDLQDEDRYRRGQESVWSRYGKNLAICCGDFYLSTAYAVLSELSCISILPQLFQLMHQRVSAAVLGQCADLAVTSTPLQLTSYLEIVKEKSGALLSLPLELVLMVTGQSNFIELARGACQDFSVGFQVIDDLRDMSTDTGDASRLVNGAERLNIVSIYAKLNRAVSAQADPIVAAKMLAHTHLNKAESALAQLPAHIGFLLEECCQNLRSQLDELH